MKINFTIKTTGRKYLFEESDVLNIQQLNLSLLDSSIRSSRSIHTGFEIIEHTPEEIEELAEISLIEYTNALQKALQ